MIGQLTAQSETRRHARRGVHSQFRRPPSSGCGLSDHLARARDVSGTPIASPSYTARRAAFRSACRAPLSDTFRRRCTTGWTLSTRSSCTAPNSHNMLPSWRNVARPTFTSSRTQTPISSQYAVSSTVFKLYVYGYSGGRCPPIHQGPQRWGPINLEH